MPPATPLSGAQTIHPNSEQSYIPQIQYSEEAKKHIMFRRQRMIAARDIRDSMHEEWDDMPFLKWFEVMKKLDDQYVPPRKNKQDTAIQTGTARDKNTSLLEYAMKYDFEPVAQVYDDSDEMLEELAEVGEDLVRKSLLMEDFKTKSRLITRSLIAFGTAMVEDRFVERWAIEKQFGKGAMLGSDSVKWTERKVRQYDGCEAKLWDLRKIYFGDIRKYFLNGPQGQPYMFTVEYEAYDVVKQFFSDWERFKYVPNTVVPTPEISAPATYSAWWTLRPVTLNYCELIRYYDPITNEYAFTINGVDMLPIQEKKVTEIQAEQSVEKTLISGFPLTAMSPSGAIPFAKFDLEPMHDFTYSKPQTAKMRVWQDVENMIVKLFIGAFKQKVKPTLGNMSGRTFGEEITDPGTVISDVREGEIFPVLPNFQGVMPADFSFYEMIKKGIDQNSIERSFQGIDPLSPTDKTATAEMNDMKAMALKVGALFDGLVSGYNQLYWLRTYNITANWTKPVDQRVDVVRKQIEQIYRTVSLPSEIDGGQKAMKKIVFTKDTSRTSEDVHQEELDYAKNNAGAEVRIAYLHVEQFASLRAKWFYQCVPVPNGTDPLSYLMFAKQITDATAMFGPDSLNVKKLKHRFAALTGMDFDTWFINEKELQQKQQAAQQQQQAAAAQGGNNNGSGGSSTSAPPGGGGLPAGGGQPSIMSATRGKQPQVATVMR
jgi:hypothetical protein